MGQVKKAATKIKPANYWRSALEMNYEGKRDSILE